MGKLATLHDVLTQPTAAPSFNGMDNATSFGTQASTYAAARPHYPEELFDWIVSQAPGTEQVWDVGTGSGQAALSLANRFERVHATDIDAAQIEHAANHDCIDYRTAPAHKSGLQDNSVDAITVATALHWFDYRLFWPEVERVAKNDAIFCGWTYHRVQADRDVRMHLMDPILEVIEPYWSDGNRLSWSGYTKENVSIPFDIIKTPKFLCRLNWTPGQLAAFAMSWSAHKRARLDGHEKALADIERKALSILGEEPRDFIMPLHVITARIKSTS